MQLISYVILLVQYMILVNAKWVMDVDSSVLSEINENPTMGYLIKFHAPWCGHCRHFEPVYEEIAQAVQELSSTDDELKNIRVVRIDATVYSDIANYYDIRGFPTIKFIRGNQIFSYENERTKSAILNFLKRVNGPSLRWITSIEQFEQIRHQHDVFFLLVTTDDQNDDLLKEYENIITRYLSQAYFYATNNSIIQQTYFEKYSLDNNQSQIFAIKKEGFYLYKPNNMNNSLEEFILKEKVETYPQIAAGNIYDLILTNKIIVIYGFNEQQQEQNQLDKRNKLKIQIYNYIINHSSTLHNTFQFAWSNDLELLNNIAVWTLEEPLIFLYDSIQRKYGTHTLSSMFNKNAIDIESILDYIVANYTDIIQHTGNTWSKRLIRPFWEFYRTLINMFIEAPGLSMLIMGLPAAVLSIVCYCLCCLPNESLLHETENLQDGENQKKDD